AAGQVPPGRAAATAPGVAAVQEEDVVDARRGLGRVRRRGDVARPTGGERVPLAERDRDGERGRALDRAVGRPGTATGGVAGVGRLPVQLAMTTARSCATARAEASAAACCCRRSAYVAPASTTRALIPSRSGASRSATMIATAPWAPRFRLSCIGTSPCWSG